MKLELDGFVPCLIGFVTLTVVVTGVVPAYGVQVPQGYWQFDGDGNDGSGHNLALEMNGGLSFVQGLFAQALDLPRDNNKFAYRPVDDGILDFGASNFTIQVWVNYHSTGGEQVLIEKFQGQTGPGWTLTKLSGNEFRFHANPAIILTSPSQTITTSVWHQVVVRRNGTSIDILFDANRIAIGNAGTTPISDASNGLLIGRRNSGDWNNYSMNGMLDEIAIWTCALSDAEINLLYNGGSGRPVRQSVSIGSPRRSGEILAGDALRFAAYRADWQDLGPFVLRWDFGDGHSSALENPGIVNLVGTGTKAVTLYVTDNQGQQDPNPDTRTITVLPATNSIPDLAVTQLNVPGNLAIGQPAAITYTVRNAGDGNLSGKSWKDALYLSRDAYLDVNDRLLVSAAVSNNVAVGGSYTNTLTATLPAVEEGAYYLLLSVNDEWQFLERHRLNNEFSVATDLVIPRLTNAAPFTASLSGNGDEQYFRIDVPAGQNLLIQLDDADNQGANEVYVRFGALPSRGTFDFRAATPSRADQQLLIPAAAPGTYYILIHGESVPGNGQFTLQATTSRLEVTSVTPGRYGQSTSAVLTVTGAGFDTTTVAELVAAGGAVYRATSVSADSFTQLTATFNLSSAPVGVYSVRVTSPVWGTNTLANAFEVLPAGEAKLETSLIVPGQLGYHALATVYVEYRNTGNAAMPAPLLVLTATQNGREGAFLTLQPTRLAQGFWTSADPEGFSHSVQLLASGDTPGVLQPGESVRVPVYYAGWQQPWNFSYPPFQWNLGVLTAEDTNAVDWASLQTSMKPASISAEAWDAIWASFVAQVGTAWGGYVRMLDDNASYLGRLGQRVLDVGQLLAFELLQADGLSPLRTLAGAVDAAVEAPGLPLVFSRSFPEPISQRFELGPLGRGWSHNWQYSLTVAADGTVTVLGPGGSRRTFQPDSRYSGSYFAQSGDHATLTPLGGGAFTLREPAGLLRAFRADGKLDYVQDLNGNRITAAYSGNLLTSLTHSSGQRLTITYGAGGHIQSITDHLSRQTVFSYDGANEHLVSAQYYDGRTATYQYQSLLTSAATHALTSVANSCCTRRYFTYDAQGRLNGTHLEGNAEAVSFAYDTAGKVSATDALGGASKFYFDHRGLLAKTEDALGNAVHLAFDDDYNLGRLTDPAGRSYNYAYDTRGNLTQTTDPLGHASRFTYQASFNRLASVTDANTNLTRYAYTANGNLQSITYPDGSREGWAYDALGNATTWTNRRARPISYAYDGAGRITNKAFADGSRMIYACDARGNLTNTTDATGATALSYDGNDRLSRITYPGGRFLQFTYDTAGRRDSSVDQLGHRLIYAYDAAGRLESMTNELGQAVVRYAYDAAGRLARKTLGNGVFVTYAYDAAGQLLGLTNFLASGTVLSRFDYAYDTRGRRTAMDMLDGHWTCDYDDLGQLTHAVLTSTALDIPDQDLTCVYDALGNRIRTIENGVTTEYTANNLNEYVQRSEVGGQRSEYIHDADGNLIGEITTDNGQRTTNTFVYNDENRLIAVTNAVGYWQYVYDPFGNRVATTENGVSTRYVIDPIGLGNVVGEYGAVGNLIAHYDHGLGLLSLTDAVGNPAYYTFDAIGNAQQLVTAADAVANAYAYAPFGTLLRRTETISNPFQFVGQFGVMKEGHGLSFMRARFYSPDHGRFSTCDPIGVRGGVNLYRYGLNSPAQLIDPIGLSGSWQSDVSLAPNPSSSSLSYTDPQIAPNPGTIIKPLLEDTLRNMGWHFNPRPFEFPWRQPIMEFPWSGWPLKPKPEPNVVTVPWDEWKTGGPWLVKPDTVLRPAFPNVDDDWLRKHFPWSNLLPKIPAGQNASSGSQDPNTKTGPAGFGTNGFVSPNGSFAYRIDFENETNASAPAQQVVISDPLSPNLDWAMFQLAELGWGDQFIAVPPNTAHFETNVPVSCLGTNFEVQIEAGLRSASGQAYAIFRSIDPVTGLPPAVNVGFLPPEDGTGCGMGHVSFTLRAKAGLATGTQIRNVAQISFDNQPAIATNQRDPHNSGAGTDPAKECLNTIDAVAPTSHVLPLVASNPQTQFQVQWTGQDDAGGSGVASYDVLVSDNGGPWVLWTNTILASAVYRGLDGHTYGFYSMARDQVGLVESAPSVADAVTKVVAQPILEVIVTTDPAQPVMDQGFDYTITVTNSGGREATGVALVNLIPDALTLVSVTFSRGNCGISEGLVMWSLSSLAANSGASLIVSVLCSTEGPVTNYISVTASPGIIGIVSTPVFDVAGLAPKLSIGKSNELIVISWPKWADGFLLEATARLSSANWVSVTNRINVVGYENVVVIDQVTASKFYRLRKGPAVSTGPSLSISRTNNNQVVIAWPVSSSDYVLESTVSLGAQGTWAAVTNAAVVLGDQKAVTLKVLGSSRFYRVRKP